MKKKPKLIFKINRNNTSKIYVGGKWQKDVVEVNMQARPQDYNVEITQYKRDSVGSFYALHDDCIEREKKIFHFGAGG